MEIKIIEMMWTTNFGAMYLAKHKKEKCLLKVEEFRDPKIYNVQLKFDKNIARKHPKYFLILKSHGTVKISPRQKPMPEWMIGDLRANLEASDKPKKYYFLVYTPSPTATLHHLGKEAFRSKEFYLRMVLDVITAANILRKAGFAHNDIERATLLFNGKNFMLADYGKVARIPKNDTHSDIQSIFRSCLFFHTPEHADTGDLADKMADDPEYIEAMRITSSVKSRAIREFCALMLYCMRFPKEYVKYQGIKKSEKPIVPSPAIISLTIKHIEDKNYDEILRPFKGDKLDD